MTARVLIGVALAAAFLSAQQTRDIGTAAPAGTATLAGTVLASDGSNTPVRRAIVSITSAELGNPRELSTDDQGHFAFTSLPAGSINLVVSKPGYVTTYYGARRPGRAPGQAILLASGQTIANVTVRLLHGASISGTILNQNNQGQYDMRVRVFEYQMQDGVRTLVTAPVTVSGGYTDDRGNYRIWGLPPGTFVLSVTPEDYSPEITTRAVTPEEIRWAEQAGRSGASPAAPVPPLPAGASGRAVTYVPVYFPGVTDPDDIETITVAASEERLNANVKLPLVTTARVEGVVIAPDGQPATTGVRFTVAQPQPRPPGAGGLEIQLNDKGQWVIPAVPPGRYTLIARAPSRQPTGGRSGGGPADVDAFALLDLTVTGQDVSGLVLAMQRGAVVSGRVVYEGRSLPAPKDFGGARITLAPAPGSPLGGTSQNVVVTPDGTFSFAGTTPGRYRFTATVPPGWTLKSAIVGERDALDSPIDIRPGEDVTGLTLSFTDQRTELSGSLLDANNAPQSDYLVIVFSTNRAFWTTSGRRGRAVRTGADGRFSIAGLPAGEYHVSVITDADQVDLGDAAVLEPLTAASVKVTLADGERRVQNLKLAGGR